MLPVGLGDLDWIAFLAAVVANIALGFVWYLPSLPTGRIWMKGAGISDVHPPAGDAAAQAAFRRSMGQMMVLTLVTALLVSGVLGLFFAMMAKAAGADLALEDGCLGGLLVWAGFFLPLNLGAVAYERKPWSYAMVVTGYWLLTSVVAGVIYATMAY